VSAGTKVSHGSGSDSQAEKLFSAMPKAEELARERLNWRQVPLQLSLQL
jgi:hypothetical protein